MLIRHRPSVPLNSAVDCIWLSSRGEDAPHCEHMLPSGKAHLVFTLHESPITWVAAGEQERWHSWTRGIVHGPQSTYYRTGPKPKGRVIGVSFNVGTAEVLLGVPMSELLDRHVGIDELWGCRSEELRDRLATAETPRAAIAILERELIARIRRPLLLHPAVAEALRHDLCNIQGSPGPMRVGDIQRRSGYSPRHFIEVFRSSVGLLPKQYFRIQRFSSALKRIARGGESFAEVALSSGYADQAHLSREFRELAGVTPSAYNPPAIDSEHHHVVGGK